MIRHKKDGLRMATPPPDPEAMNLDQACNSVQGATAMARVVFRCGLTRS
jgi:hypothetical protein